MPSGRINLDRLSLAQVKFDSGTFLEPVGRHVMVHDVGIGGDHSSDRYFTTPRPRSMRSHSSFPKTPNAPRKQYRRNSKPHTVAPMSLTFGNEHWSSVVDGIGRFNDESPHSIDYSSASTQSHSQSRSRERNSPIPRIRPSELLPGMVDEEDGLSRSSRGGYFPPMESPVNSPSASWGEIRRR